MILGYREIRLIDVWLMVCEYLEKRSSWGRVRRLVAICFTIYFSLLAVSLLDFVFVVLPWPCSLVPTSDRGHLLAMCDGDDNLKV